MFKGLGVNTDPDEPTDPEGNPLPEDYNPLGKKCGVFSPLNEIFFAGVYSSFNDKSNYLIDDLKAGLGGLYTSASGNSWEESTFENCIGADVDGDGFQEVVVIYFGGSVPDSTLNLKVIDNEGGTWTEYNKTIMTGIESVPAISQYQPALAKGDLDCDGKDELIMGFAYYAYIIEDADSGYSLTSKNYSHSRDLYIAAGNIDGDPGDEFIVTYYYSGNAYCDIFDGDFSHPFLSRYEYHLHNENLLGGFTVEQQVHACMGDIDGDLIDEIVFHGESNVGDEVWSLLAMDDAKTGFAWLDFYTCTFDNRRIWEGGFSAALTLLDCNGDGLTDIFASNGIYDYKPGSSSGHPYSPSNHNIDRLVTIFDNTPANV